MQFWKENVLRGWARDARAMREFESSLRPVLIRREDGPLQLMHALPVKADLHTTMFERLTRGFYRHCFEEMLPIGTPIAIRWVKDPQPYAQFFHPRGIFQVGNHFRYCVARAPDNPLASLWLFGFYDGHFTAAWTGPLAVEDAPEESFAALADLARSVALRD